MNQSGLKSASPLVDIITAYTTNASRMATRAPATETVTLLRRLSPYRLMIGYEIRVCEPMIQANMADVREGSFNVHTQDR